MEGFLRYFFQDISNVFKSLVAFLAGFWDFLVTLVDYKKRAELVAEFHTDFNAGDWIILLVANIIFLILLIVALVFLLKLIRKMFKLPISAKQHRKLEAKIKALQQDVIRANHEKDKLLAMNIGALGLKGANDEEGAEEGKDGEEFVEGKRNTTDSPMVDPLNSRFFRLTEIDNFYKAQPEVKPFESSFTLEELCERFRMYAAYELKLYYEIGIIRHFIASMATARIIILQGISGTGKTSLPYAFGKFVQRDTTVISVQPAWRERTELYGYFNEFTKKYSETDFLASIYEATYYKDPHLVILDEMNIARVEYYFAEMLSILEMPNPDEWNVSVTNAVWDNDPCKLNGGSLHIPENIWFVGTINNDDSTFAVADKVYDRAIPIDLDSRAIAFDPDPAESIHLNIDDFYAKFKEAKETYALSLDMSEKLETLNDYLIKNFKLAFGNRIMKQLGEYIPNYIACGGTEEEGIDFMIAKKILRKFESLNLGFMKDELETFTNYLDRLFGKDVMINCKTYIESLMKEN